MYMKYLILISIVALSCGLTIPQQKANTALVNAADIPYKVAERYFVRNDYNKKDHLNPKIKTKAEFNNVFGMATIMGGQPTPIDFSTQYVLSVIGELTNKNIQIVPLSLKQKGGTIIFNYKVVVGEEQSATIQPLLLIIVNKKYNGKVRLVKN